LEDQLVKVIEESEIEQLKAVDAMRKYEETFMQQVQELQKQVRVLQSSEKSCGGKVITSSH
jgi:hypothetical protein